MLYIGIPAHNEATTIGVLLWRLRSVLSDVSREYEVVVYDDASSDETAATLAPYSRVLPLTVLRGEQRLGYAGAVNAIARHVARTTRYPRRDALLLLQGDFTDPPALVPEFLRRFEGGADLVIGERTSPGDAPLAVRRLWKAARWVLRPFVGITDVRDLTSSYRLVRIAVLRDLIKANGDTPIIAGDDWSANADFLLRTAPLARRVETIPITPTFSVRTRETRRTAWPDAVALARWGWRRRGERVAVRVIARTVEVPETPDELIAPEPSERVVAPERREPRERSERTERRPRRERAGQEGGEREPRSRSTGRDGRRERPTEDGVEEAGGERSKRTRGRTPREKPADGVVGALPDEKARAEASGGDESLASDMDGANPERRKRRKRSRSRGERAASSSTEAEASLEADEERTRPAGETVDESESSETDGSEAGVARRRKRSRRGRRKRTAGTAGEGTDAENGHETDDSTRAEGEGEADETVRGSRRATRRRDRGEASEAGDGEAGADGLSGDGDADGGGADDSPRRRRSRRGRRGGSRRRSEGAPDGVGGDESRGEARGEPRSEAPRVEPSGDA